jgi:hypothetical protein
MDSIQPHRIALKSRVLMESPKDLLSGQYLCGTFRLDTSHIIHKVCIRDASGKMQRVRAVINRSVTSIFMAPRLRKRLGLADEPASLKTSGLTSHGMAHASESRNTTFMVQYMEHFSLLQETELLVVPIRAYELVLGLPWFQSRDPDVDWQNGRLLALRTPGGAEVVAVDWVNHQEYRGNAPGSTAREK